MVMGIKKIWAISFSPTGGTKHIVQIIAEKIGEQLHLPVETVSFTLPQERKKHYTFTEEDLLLLGIPVYAGRIPNKILPDVENNFSGNHTPAVAVSVFGNRSVDDALMELTLLMEKQGFYVMAAAATANRHAFFDSIGQGRPDYQDIEELRSFAKAIAEKLKKIPDKNAKILSAQIIGHNPVGAYYTPLREDGKPARFLKAKPMTKTNLCTHCGICAKVCPMGSINLEKVDIVEGICIKCQACIRSCPVHAKYFEDEDFLSHVEMLKKNYRRRAENRFFL